MKQWRKPIGEPFRVKSDFRASVIPTPKPAASRHFNWFWPAAGPSCQLGHGSNVLPFMDYAISKPTPKAARIASRLLRLETVSAVRQMARAAARRRPVSTTYACQIFLNFTP
jgi:hypothetical protein